MKKMFAVLKREYLQSVRRKMFIIMTILLPFLMAALVVVPAVVMAKGMGKKRIAVLDGTGRLAAAFQRPNAPDEPDQPAADARKEARKALTGGNRRDPAAELQIEYVHMPGVSEANARPYLDRLTRADDAPDKLEGVFLIPDAALTDLDTGMQYYSRAATDVITQERLARRANKSLQRMRLSQHGIQPDVVERLLEDLDVESVQISRSGETKRGGELNVIVAFIFGILLVLPSLVYGQETMRGIVQEKTDRVVEVLVSSVSPLQLLTGKIVGVAAVGLTQIAAWLLMFAAIGIFGAASAVMAGVNLAQFIRPIVGLYFVVFFVLAYLTYVCVYAVAGAISNSEREAQQFMMPIMMLMMMPYFLMVPITLNPDAPFAVAFSLAPIFGPMTMFIRTVVTEPPLWHVLTSIGVSVVTIAAFFWVTAKIFRVGILSYGKRPTIPELMRWVRVA